MLRRLFNIAQMQKQDASHTIQMMLVRDLPELVGAFRIEFM